MVCCRTGPASSELGTVCFCIPPGYSVATAIAADAMFNGFESVTWAAAGWLMRIRLQKIAKSKLAPCGVIVLRLGIINI